MKLSMNPIFAVLALSSAVPAFAASEEIIQLPDQVFTPTGFDDNDRAEVVLHGFFPDTCYRAGEATATVVGGTIQITNSAYRDTASDCMKMIIPWTTRVPVGVLKAGNYPINVLSPTGKWIFFDSVNVTVATKSSVDDFLYAYVNGITVNSDTQDGTPQVSLSGSFSISCMYISEVRILRNKPNVVDILPIVALDTSVPCGHLFVPKPFQETLFLTKPFKPGGTLIHVRSVNGQAVNRVVD